MCGFQVCATTLPPVDPHFTIRASELCDVTHTKPYFGGGCSCLLLLFICDHSHEGATLENAPFHAALALHRLLPVRVSENTSRPLELPLHPLWHILNLLELHIGIILLLENTTIRPIEG